MKQGLFEVFGQGELGLKAEDLNQYSVLITEAGMSVVPGSVIANGIFDRLVALFGLREGTTAEEIAKRDCPDFLLSINEEILDGLEVGRPYAIRSSALSERGGTGIYKSVFFQPSGERQRDLLRLWRCEAEVYASELTVDARLWRERTNGKTGMAILIQAVIGFRLEGYFLPALAGVAYTSYQGLPTVRAVCGLGTKAVNGEGVIYNSAVDHLFLLQREMWEQEEMETIGSDGVVGIPGQDDDILLEVEISFKAFQRLFECLDKLRERGCFYFEWVIYKDTIFVVQCATYEDRLSGNAPFDSSGHFLLLQGSDVLHSGRASCKSLVYVSEWSPRTAHMLEVLNEEMKDYLLIVPQQSTSLVADMVLDRTSGLSNQRLAFRHFSNALAVVERQVRYTHRQAIQMLTLGENPADHSDGRGASHFSQLCERTDILFIGAQFDPRPLIDLPGGMEYRTGLGIQIWNVEAEVVVNPNEGYVYVGKQVKGKMNDYSQGQLREWSDDLRATANMIANRGDSETANHFYNIHYAIGPDSSPADFDQFKLDDDAVEMMGGVDQLVTSLKAVLDCGEDKDIIDADWWNDGPRDYLTKLHLHLTRA